MWKHRSSAPSAPLLKKVFIWFQAKKMISTTFQPITKYANTIWFLRSLENGLNLIAALFNIHPIALSLRAAYEKCWRKNDTKAKTLTRKANKALRLEVFFEALPQGTMHIRFISQEDSLTFYKPQVSWRMRWCLLARELQACFLYPDQPRALLGVLLEIRECLCDEKC